MQPACPAGIGVAVAQKGAVLDPDVSATLSSAARREAPYTKLRCFDFALKFRSFGGLAAMAVQEGRRMRSASTPGIAVRLKPELLVNSESTERGVCSKG